MRSKNCSTLSNKPCGVERIIEEYQVDLTNFQVSNKPCGVERRYFLTSLLSRTRFLINLVELKAESSFKPPFYRIMFLINLVELKVSGLIGVCYSLCYIVSNKPCGVESV